MSAEAAEEVTLIQEDEPHEPTGGVELLERRIWMWHLALERIHQRLVPEMFTDVWIDGLRAAGFEAKRGTKWNGFRSVPLPYVFDIPCPLRHRSEDEADFARTLFIVLDDGWVRFNPSLKGQCPNCNARDLAVWLMECPRCEAGEDSEWHRPGHPKGSSQIRGRKASGKGLFGDTSPLSFVTHQFEVMWELANARRWVEQTEEAAAEYRRDCGYAELGTLSRHMIDDCVERNVRRARWVLDAVKVQPSSSAKAIARFTAESTVKWLEEIKDAEGNLAVPASTSGAAAWRIVEPLPGRPPKRFVEAAQSQRKSRPPSP